LQNPTGATEQNVTQTSDVRNSKSHPCSTAGCCHLAKK